MRKSRPGNPKLAIGYVRVSTSRQELSPEVQRAAIEVYAARHGAVVVSWHEDRGVSGAAPLDEREGLLGAVAAVREHGAGYLIVNDRTRLARDVVTAAMTERAVASAGGTIVSANGAGNGTTPEAALMRTILDGVGAYERSLIRARTKAALAAKRARGEKLGGRVPYGYEVGPDGRSLVPLDAEQAVIVTVRSLRSDGVALRGIVARLADLGVVSRAGTPLGLTQVARLLAATAAPTTPAAA